MPIEKGQSYQRIIRLIPQFYTLLSKSDRPHSLDALQIGKIAPFPLGHYSQNAVYFWFQQLHWDTSGWPKDLKVIRICSPLQGHIEQLGEAFPYFVCKFLLI